MADITSVDLARECHRRDQRLTSPEDLHGAVSYTKITDVASRLRRTYLHTEQATTFPAPAHLCDLAAEYL